MEAEMLLAPSLTDDAADEEAAASVAVAVAPGVDVMVTPAEAQYAVPNVAAARCLSVYQ